MRQIAKNIIKVEGVVASGKQYARAFQPTMTREEYAAQVMCEMGIRDEKAIAKNGKGIRGKQQGCFGKAAGKYDTGIERLTIKSQASKCVEVVHGRWPKKGIAKQRLLRASFG